ncbi:undecaprenyl-diphosphate phosphatase [bacterium]|nr:undecaprenyl-diphosphate phosphatase [bacterium]
MSIIEIIFLSIVQGITEWLPISSSGHLVIFENWLGIEEASLSFDVFLHVATLVVILFFFRKQIWEILKTPLDKKDSNRKNWLWYIILSSATTVLIALALYDSIDYFRTIDSVGGWLIVTAILLLSTKFVKGSKNIKWYHAIALGAIQGLAVVPGLSRSGAMIAIALVMKIKKSQAFDYAFIAAVPAIAGSFLLTMGDFVFNRWHLLGFIITVIISYLALNFLKLLLKRNYFYLFFIYTLALGLIIKFI